MSNLRIQFIYSSDEGRPSADTKHLVHSHAARATHAKSRRKRLVEYQANNDQKQLQHRSTPVVVEVDGSTIPSPVSLLGSGHRDPFASFARRLEPVEDFLLYYCK